MKSPNGHELTIQKDNEKPNVVHVRFLYSDQTDINIFDIENFFAEKGFKSTSYGGTFDPY